MVNAMSNARPPGEDDDGEPDDLIAELCARLTAFIQREAVKIRDGDDVAEFKVRLSQPQGDDDGTLCLDYVVEELTVTSPRGAGARVNGIKWRP